MRDIGAGRLIANHLFLCYSFVISCLREFRLFSQLANDVSYTHVILYNITLCQYNVVSTLLATEQGPYY